MKRETQSAALNLPTSVKRAKQARHLLAAMVLGLSFAPDYALAGPDTPESNSSESNIPGSFSGSMSLVTNYVFRGITQTDEEPGIQGSLDWSHESGFYLGTWAGNVDFNDGDEAHIEIDLYGGYGFSYGGFDFDLGAACYLYPGASSSLNYDYGELYGSVGYDAGFASLTGGLYYSPENFGNSGDAFYPYLKINAPLAKTGISAGAHIGRQTIEDNSAFGLPDYTDWSLSLAYDLSKADSVFEGMETGLTYTDTNLSKSACADGCGQAITWNVTKKF